VIGLDTNVIVRYLVQDDAEQGRAAARLITTHCTAQDPGFILLLVLAELVWVLDRAYGYSREQISMVIEALLGTAEIRVEQPDLARRALTVYRDTRIDYADCLVGLSNLVQGCEATVTFDRRAVKSGWHRLLK
jgi:predicted nucleic-acid-binding protein